MRRALLVVLAAVLYAAATPPWSVDVLAPVVLAPLIVALRGLPPRRGAVAGLGFGLVAAALVSWWTVAMIDRFFGAGLVAGVLGSAVVYLLTAGVPFALFGAAAARLLVGPAWAAWAAVPAAWVAVELVRAHAFTGLPWELLGHALYRRLALIQVADVTGAYGLSFLCAASAVVLADLAVPAARSRRPALVALAVVAGVWGAAYAYGERRLAALAVPAGTPMPVAVVQANRAPARHVTPVTTDATLRAYLTLTRERLAAHASELIVWPENTAGYYLDRSPGPLGILTRLARDTGATLLVGGPREDARTGAEHNAAYAIGAEGILGAHDKVRLVPLAEYAPPGLSALAAPAATVAPGDALRPLPHARGPLGVLICYEVLYPRLARELVRAGAAVLVNMANDAWSDPSGSAAAWQTLSMAVFRAVETRRWIVRAATTGVSGFIEPTGRLRALLDPGAAGVLRADVTPRTALTPYVRFGDAFAWACVAVALATLPLARVREGRP